VSVQREDSQRGYKTLHPEIDRMAVLELPDLSRPTSKVQARSGPGAARNRRLTASTPCRDRRSCGVQNIFAFAANCMI